MPPTQDLTAEMQSQAAYAIRMAKKKFGRSLDLSRRSLPALDALLAQAYKRFCELDNQGRLTDEMILHTTRIWGSYLGEMVRRNWGGHWARRDGKAVLVLGGIKVDPIQAVLGAVTDPGSELASDWFTSVEEKLGAHGFTPLLSSHVLESYNRLRSRLPSLHITPAIWAGVLIAGLLVLLLSAISPAIRAISAWQFNSSLDRFLAEGQKLSAMSEDDMAAFKDQLARVKWAYAQTGANWPVSYALRKIEFAEAIRGWDFAVSVWEYSRTASGPVPFISEGNAPGEVLKGICAYMGIGFSTGARMSVEEWTTALASAASRHFTSAGESR